MKLKKRILLALGFISALASSTALAADAPYTSVLSGTVTDVASVGQTVKEGDVLVQVDSLAGPMPAIRAKKQGVVTKVNTKPGNQIQKGDVIIVVDEA